MRTEQSKFHQFPNEEDQHPQKQMLAGGEHDAPSFEDGHQEFPQSEELAWEILSGVWVNAEGKLVEMKLV